MINCLLFLLLSSTVSFFAPSGEEVVYTFNEQGQVIEEAIIKDGIVLQSTPWEPLETPLLATKMGSTIKAEGYSPFPSFFSYFWEQGASLMQKQKDALELIANQIFGEFRLFLLGVYPETHAASVYGKGEISNNLRITAINGILNQKKHWEDFSQMISELHGDVNVHAIYWPSEGWTKDMYKCILAKSGTVSESAKQLSILWRQMIEEMGGINSDGMIIHYAHSVGSLESYVARTLMTAKELQKIKVITFGAPYFFPDEEFKQVTHYASCRDGITLLDPFNYLNAVAQPQSHVIFLSNYYEGLPLVDHFINDGSYNEQLILLGSEFIEQYGFIP